MVKIVKSIVMMTFVNTGMSFVDLISRSVSQGPCPRILFWFEKLLNPTHKRWHLRHRHTMSWRTFDHYKGKFADYPLEWNHETDQLEIMKVGMKTPLEPPFDENMNPKDPMDDLENILSGDGREGRRVITINNQVCSFNGNNLSAIRH